MKFCRRTVLQVALCSALGLALGASALAADNAYLYLVQGIPGYDVSKNLNPGYPVDILIDGDCLVRGLTFSNTSGPLSLSAGTYDVQISEANSLAPCTNAAVSSAQVAVEATTSTTIVAALNGSAQPTLLQFADNLSPVTAGNARFVFANAADAPALQATLTQVYVKNPKTFTLTAASGAEASASVTAGTYLVQVIASGSTTVLASEQMGLADQSATFTYAAGEAANNSVGLINRVVKEVF
ncbi:MAG: DUF4397 domain-containing protein [Terriglobales bacterium]|jgi:uncharacterized protein DUF4397